MYITTFENVCLSSIMLSKSPPVQALRACTGGLLRSKGLDKKISRFAPDPPAGPRETAGRRTCPSLRRRRGFALPF